MKDLEDEKANVDARKGIFDGVLIHLIGIPTITGLIGAINSQGAVALMFIGAFQAFYLVPAMGIAWYRGSSRDFMKGMAITALVVFLLNAACFGLFAASVAFGGPWYGG